MTRNDNYFQKKKKKAQCKGLKANPDVKRPIILSARIKENVFVRDEKTQIALHLQREKVINYLDN